MSETSSHIDDPLEALIREAECVDDALRNRRALPETSSLPPEITRGLHLLNTVYGGSTRREPDSRLPCQFQDLSQSTVLGRFEIREQVGAGSYGIVYRAYDPLLKRDVAVKVSRLNTALSDKLMARFLRESEAAARLHHPHIVPVIDVGSEGATAFIVSEYCPGITLGEWLARQPGPVPPVTAARIIAALADAVEHAHQARILHRDLKPGNILVTDCSSTEQDRPIEETVRLTDFGLARFMDQSGSTIDGDLVGTIQYMSPEQVRGDSDRVDPASDVYSLGVILYQLLTKQTPFAGDSHAHTLKRICDEEPVAPKRVNPAVPQDLQSICLRCLQTAPHRRYPSAKELRLDLERFLDGRPTQARPISVIERVVRWVDANRLVTALATLAILGLAMALVVSRRAAVDAQQHAEELADSLERIRLESDRADAAALRAERRALEAQQAMTKERRGTYVSNMRFAFRQWDQGLLCDVRTLLDAQIPDEGQDDLRGLEWHLLSAQVDSRYRPIGRHEGPVADVDVFPDGHTFATAGEDGVVRVWNADSLSLLREFSLQDKPLYTVGVSPDGKWLAYGAGSRDSPELKPVTLIDAHTGVVLGTTNWHDTTIRQARFSPDGRFLASGSVQEKVSLWEFTDGVRGQSYDLTEPYADPENFDIQFLDDRLLLTEFHKRTGYRVWDVATGDAVHDYPGLCQRNVRVATWCRPHALLAYVPRSSHGHDNPIHYNAVHLLDTAGGDDIGRFDVGVDTVGCLDFEPRSNTLYVGTGNGQIHAWRISLSGEPSLERSIDVAGSRPLQAHFGSVSRVRALDESRVVSTGADGRVVVLRPDRGETRSSPFGGDDWGLVAHMAASPGQNLIAWSGADGEVRLADRASGRFLSESRPLSGQPMHLTWSGDGTHVAAICQAGELACWRIEDHALVECLRSSVADFSRFEAGLALNNDGSVLYVGGDRGPDGFHVWNVRTQDKMDFVPTLYRVQRLAVSPDDRFLIGAQEGIFVFDRESHTQLHYLQQGGVCFTLAFAPDRKTLIAGYRDGVIRLWDVGEGKLLRVLPEYDRISRATTALMLSADGQTLVAGDAVGRLRFWNTQAWDYLGAMRLFSTTDTTNEPRKIVAMEVAPERHAIDIVYGRDGSNTSRFAQLPLTPD